MFWALNGATATPAPVQPPADAGGEHALARVGRGAGDQQPAAHRPLARRGAEAGGELSGRVPQQRATGGGDQPTAGQRPAARATAARPTVPESRAARFRCRASGGGRRPGRVAPRSARSRRCGRRAGRPARRPWPPRTGRRWGWDGVRGPVARPARPAAGRRATVGAAATVSSPVSRAGTRLRRSSSRAAARAEPGVARASGARPSRRGCSTAR